MVANKLAKMVASKSSTELSIFDDMDKLAKSIVVVEPEPEVHHPVALDRPRA
jgi:hypothetical protein